MRDPSALERSRPRPAAHVSVGEQGCSRRNQSDVIAPAWGQRPNRRNLISLIPRSVRSGRARCTVVLIARVSRRVTRRSICSVDRCETAQRGRPQGSTPTRCQRSAYERARSVAGGIVSASPRSLALGDVTAHTLC